MNLISVIMPVYNSKKYLEEAVNSVLKQTYINFELILIDDGSTDGSAEICDLLKEKDTRIRVIHKKNEGVCKTRNLGIVESTGKYIAFIDNDDEYDENFLQDLYNKMIETKSDIIKCGRENIKITEDSKIISKKACLCEERVYDQRQFIDNYYEIRKSGILSSVWNSLYSAEIIKNNNIFFEENLKHGNEDIIFNVKFFKKCKKIAMVEKILYIHYYRISHSTSMKFYEDQIDSRIYAIELEKEFIRNTTNEKQQKLLSYDGIIECFKILTMAKESNNCRNNGIEKIINTKFYLDLDKTPIMSDCNLSLKKKIELFLIKYKLYWLYFKIYRVIKLFK